MKRFFCSILSVAIVLASFSHIANVQAAVERIMPDVEYTVSVASKLYPESAHNYSNFAKENYTFEYPGAVSLTVKFSEKCQTEQDYDFVYLYDGSNRVIGKYSGSELAGKTVKIDGSVFRIRLWTDRSKTFYGFSIDEIVAQVGANSYSNGGMREEIKDSALYPDTVHNYTNNTDETYKYINACASSLSLNFSKSTKTEQGFDFIYVYDYYGNELGRYSGSELAGKTVNIDTPGCAIRLVTDHSQTFFGYALDSIISHIDDNDGNNGAYPKSPHPYVTNANEEYIYKSPTPANSLNVTFSEKTMTEEDYDFISIFDEDGILVGKYSGNELAGRTLNIKGDSFSIRLTSDLSNSLYGFEITDIEAVVDFSYESEHSYGNNVHSEYVYTSPEKSAGGLNIKFSSMCKTEKDYDIVRIFNADGVIVGEYSGDELANKTVYVDTPSFKLTFDTDRSKTFYGYKIIDISSVDSQENTAQKMAYPQSNHPYENKAEQEYFYACPYENATSLKVKFSEETLTEKNYDFISIYDESGELIGKYSGDELAGRTLNIKGSKFKIRFDTDRSKSFYGFSIDSITAVSDNGFSEESETEHNYILTREISATVFRNGTKAYLCDKCADTYCENENACTSIEDYSVWLEKSSFVYDKSEHYPTVSVKSKSGEELALGEDFEVEYPKASTDIGLYYVIVTLKGEHPSSKVLYYSITPENASNLKLSPLLDGLTVEWKSSRSADGYEIQYSQSSSFSSAKTINITDRNATYQKIYSLARDRDYYVRIRSYSKSKSGVRIYSDYSSAKTVTTGFCLELNEKAAKLAYEDPNVRREIFGYSYQGRPLEAYIITPSNGKYTKTYYLNFAMHGFEGESYRDGKYLTAQANRIVEYYANNIDSFSGTRLIVIPCLNPDGVIAGKNELYYGFNAFGRCTADAVDINRDFGSFKSREARALRDLMKKYKPYALCDFHGWLDTSLGNPTLVNIFSDTLKLSKKQYNAFGYSKGYLIGYVARTYDAYSVLVEYKNSNINHYLTLDAINKMLNRL